MKPGIFVSTPDLRPSLFSILKGLDEAGLLKAVVTTVAIDPKRIPGRCIKTICNVLPSYWTRGINRRMLPDFLKNKVRTFFFRELFRLLVSRLGNDVFAHRVWLWAELGFDKNVACRFSGHFRCVYGMEHSSLETFTRQKNLRGLCILRQVMVHGRTVVKVIKREIERFPEYSTSYLNLLLVDMERSLVRKEAEYQLADLIVANSIFVKDSFTQAGVNPEKIISIPTGCPEPSNIVANPGSSAGPFIFLFVGALSLRKGFPYLIKAWHMLGAGRHVELWLVGRKELADAALRSQGYGINYFGVISQSELARIYARADVLVLPTLLEGLAHVILEALSYGLPIITTRESGCGDLVKNGRNGSVVKATDAQELCDAMAWCLEHRQQLPSMGRASLEQARLWTVADSNRAHIAAIQDFFKKNEIN